MGTTTENLTPLSGDNPGDDGTRVPYSAAWLGGLGAVPFVALATALHLLDDTSFPQYAFALATYGAVILSFLGGIHWGMAIAAPKSNSSALAANATMGKAADTLGRHLGLSVVPSLVGWGALFLLTPMALVVLALAFAMMLWFDLRASQNGEAPSWYPKLRWPLTLTVVASLLVGALA